MGARQSKRSVDITSGKEGEAGAAISGIGPLDGEARLEKIAELDTNLKPQLNGDASHLDAHTPDKEKQSENNSSENGKDESNEKEAVTPVNGTESDSAQEDKPKTPDSELEPNSDVKVAESEPKKIKKEKVKKKWSFRSISFSKKDKQKPVKKEENGEYAQVPEETQESAALVPTESTENKSTEETSPSPKDTEKSEEKAPETPVTEPMTNGSTTPESPKEEVRQNGDLSPAEQISEGSTIEVIPKVEAISADAQLNDLPLNGLTIDDVAEEKIPPPAEPVHVVVPSEPGTENASTETNTIVAEPLPVENVSVTLPATEELKMDLSPETEVSPATEIPGVPAEPVAVISEPEVPVNISEKVVSSPEPFVEVTPAEPVSTTDNGVPE